MSMLLLVCRGNIEQYFLSPGTRLYCNIVLLEDIQSYHISIRPQIQKTRSFLGSEILPNTYFSRPFKDKSRSTSSQLSYRVVSLQLCNYILHNENPDSMNSTHLYDSYHNERMQNLYQMDRHEFGQAQKTMNSKNAININGNT